MGNDSRQQRDEKAAFHLLRCAAVHYDHGRLSKADTALAEIIQTYPHFHALDVVYHLRADIHLRLQAFHEHDDTPANQVRGAIFLLEATRRRSLAAQTELIRLLGIAEHHTSLTPACTLSDEYTAIINAVIQHELGNRAIRFSHLNPNITPRFVYKFLRCYFEEKMTLDRLTVYLNGMKVLLSIVPERNNTAASETALRADILFRIANAYFLRFNEYGRKSDLNLAINYSEQLEDQYQYSSKYKDRIQPVLDRIRNWKNPTLGMRFASFCYNLFGLALFTGQSFWLSRFNKKLPLVERRQVLRRSPQKERKRAYGSFSHILHPALEKSKQKKMLAINESNDNNDNAACYYVHHSGNTTTYNGNGSLVHCAIWAKLHIHQTRQTVSATSSPKAAF